MAAGMLLAVGLVLSLLSAWEICTSSCAEGHKYRLYGMHFETVGIAFFIAANLIFWGSYKVPILRGLVKLMTASAVGAELYFLYVQKYLIGTWCPICVSIAASIVLLAAVFSFEYFVTLKQLMNADRRNEVMKKAINALASFSAGLLGLIVALVGISKAETTFASVSAEKGQSHIFGNMSSPVTVYVFSDWFCPACKKVEPIIESDFNEITQKARLVFVDVPIHEDSLNFLPYNLSFMLNNKEQYIPLRHDLIALAEEDPSPTEDQIEQLSARHGARYSPLDYSHINLGLKYFKKMAKKYEVDSTPTVVVANLKDKKARKLAGQRQIRDANIPHIIDIMSK